MQIFKVSPSYNKDMYKIEPFEAVSIGEKSVYYIDRMGKQVRGSKITNYDAYFETLEQAEQYVVDQISEDKKKADKSLDYARNKQVEANQSLLDAIKKYKTNPSK